MVATPVATPIYQLKIVLRDVTPMIWRRLLVASTTTIADLHASIQLAMGWEDLHLHQFLIYGKAYGRDGNGSRQICNGHTPFAHSAWFQTRKSALELRLFSPYFDESR